MKLIYYQWFQKIIYNKLLFLCIFEAIKVAEKYLEHAEKDYKKDNGKSKMLAVDKSKKELE